MGVPLVMEPNFDDYSCQVIHLFFFFIFFSIIYLNLNTKTQPISTQELVVIAFDSSNLG